MNDKAILGITIVLSLFALILILALMFSKKQRLIRAIKKRKLVRISDFVEDDDARIVGKIEIIGEPLYSPLSGRPCAYYHIHVEQKVQSGKSSNWRTVIDEEIYTDFVIRDGRHCAFINSDRIKTYLIQDRKFHSGFLNDAEPKLESYLTQHGKSSTGFFGFNRTMRYKEGILEQGEAVVAAGIGKWKRNEELNLKIDDHRVLEITGVEKKDWVYLSDDPKLVAIPNKKESY